MDALIYMGSALFLLFYILVCNEVVKVAKENGLDGLWSYFFISFLFSPVTGLLFVIARKNIAPISEDIEISEPENL